MRTEDQEYLSGFAFEAMVQNGSDQWTVVKAGVNYFRALLTEHEMEFDPYNRGRIDALLSAIGVDGVCSPDCICRNCNSSFVRDLFHTLEHWLIPAEAWKQPNDKQANGRFFRK